MLSNITSNDYDNMKREAKDNRRS